MSNFKIIQDVADQARVKIYGSANVALQTDSNGVLSISAPLAIGITTAQTLAITAPLAIGITTTQNLPITAPLAIGITTTQNLPITAPLAIGITTTQNLPITVPLAIGITTTQALPVTGAVITGLATSDVTSNLSVLANGFSPTFLTLSLPNFTFGVLNTSNPSDAIGVKLQTSMDNTAWVDDAGGTVTTLNGFGSFASLVPNVFMKYARVYYFNTAATDTATLWFQAHD
jgi:hypothetical protein